MEKLCLENIGIQDMTVAEMIEVGGGWTSFARELLRSALLSAAWEEAKKAGKAWMAWLEENQNMFYGPEQYAW